jgi:hypothetical protein
MHIAHAAAEGSGYASDERTDYHCECGKNGRHLGRAPRCVRRGLHLSYSVVDATVRVRVGRASLRSNQLREVSAVSGGDVSRH